MRSANIPRDELILHQGQWREAFLKDVGQYRFSPSVPEDYRGWIRPREKYGLKTIDMGSLEIEISRLRRDISLDGLDHYFLLFQIAGECAIEQRQHVSHLVPGSVGLIDAATQFKVMSGSNGVRWLSVRLPRQLVLAQFGSEPDLSKFRTSGTIASTLLSNIASNIISPHTEGCDPHLRFALFDLVGSLLAATGGSTAPIPHRTLLFRRVCGVVREAIGDTKLSPEKVAEASGLPLNTLKILLLDCGKTFGQFLMEERLKCAAAMLRDHRKSVDIEGLKAIVAACGFPSAALLTREFRRAFGQSPLDFAASS